MEQTTTFVQTRTRQSAVNALAVVGFVALVFIGMVLAIYSARYVPAAVSRLASAAAYLSTNGKSDGQLQVVPNLPFPTEATTTATSTTPVATTTAVTPKPTTPVTAGKPTTTAYPVSGVVTPSLYGLPNLITSISAVGYLDDNGVFHADKTINSNQSLAVQFRVTNIGTNVAAPWQIHAELPTRSNGTFKFNSGTQDALVPGGWVDFTLHLDARDVRVGDDQEITIDADSGNDVKESNENDNDATATISVN